MATGDVGTNRNSNKKSESMGYRCSNETSGCVGSSVGEFAEGHAGPFTGKDKNKGGDELSQGCLPGVWLSCLMVVAYGDVSDRHLCCLIKTEWGKSVYLLWLGKLSRKCSVQVLISTSQLCGRTYTESTAVVNLVY
ncbi:hypothetical protein OIU79_028323, partial [Salix purpurea]